MSVFGDYKSYKNYEPAYANLKQMRNYKEAQQEKFISSNPDKINKTDIQKSKALLRAIDIMDEYSQKRAENMEVFTEVVVGYGLDAAMFGGAAVGFALGALPPIKNFLTKIFGTDKASKNLLKIAPIAFGGIAGIISAFPLYAWAAKTEVSASRKGRFEAMQKELKHPNVFAVITDEQLKEVEEKAKKLQPEKEKKENSKSIFKMLKNMGIENKDYKIQKKKFELELLEATKHLQDEMTPEEIENAKKDQQLLTKLVEKIDIASQDYAENAELATQTLTTLALGLGVLFSLGVDKILNLLKIKSAAKISVITKTLSIAAPITLGIFSAQIQKEASRVGRFKAKQELINNPAKLAYVSDEELNSVGDVRINEVKKEGIFKFFTHAFKDNREYHKYQKTTAKTEERFYKALEDIKLTPEQDKQAKKLQRNTFKTFNKVDEKSQKYSESIEALGQAIALPISLIFTGIGAALGAKIMVKAMRSKNSVEKSTGIIKYVGLVTLSSIPSIIINAIITKEQKKASRIADMLAINELKDYREFR